MILSLAQQGAAISSKAGEQRTDMLAPQLLDFPPLLSYSTMSLQVAAAQADNVANTTGSSTNETEVESCSKKHEPARTLCVTLANMLAKVKGKT